MCPPNRPPIHVAIRPNLVGNAAPSTAKAIIDSTIPPSDPLESAIVRTLPANNAAYTAIVRGVNNTTGIAVVEAYQLQ